MRVVRREIWAHWEKTLLYWSGPRFHQEKPNLKWLEQGENLLGTDSRKCPNCQPAGRPGTKLDLRNTCSEALKSHQDSVPLAFAFLCQLPSS